MKIAYFDFITNIDKDFQELQTRFMDLTHAFENDDTETFNNLRNKWRFEHQTNGAVSRISDALYDYDDSGDFKQQINECCLNNQLGLIEFTKVLIARLYKFCEENFDKSFLYYKSFNYDVFDLLDQLYNNDKVLNDSEFLKAVEMQFIDVLGYFEDQFTMAYPLHRGQNLTNSQVDEYNEGISESKVEPILLDYSSENCNQIKAILYGTLNGEFIESMSEDEFYSYFESKPINQKIKWKGYDLELAFLFFGMELQSTFNKSKAIKIKIKNDPTKLLCNTFLKKNGKPFERKSLADNLRKGRNPKDKNRIDHRLSEMIININNKYHL